VLPGIKGLCSWCHILSAAPCAGMTSIFAQRYGRDTATAAQSVSLSTLLSLFTLPLFAALAQTMIVMM